MSFAYFCGFKRLFVQELVLCVFGLTDCYQPLSISGLQKDVLETSKHKIGF